MTIIDRHVSVAICNGSIDPMYLKLYYDQPKVHVGPTRKGERAGAGSRPLGERAGRPGGGGGGGGGVEIAYWCLSVWVGGAGQKRLHR